MAPPTGTSAPPTTQTDSSSCPYTRVSQQGEVVKKLKAEQAPKVRGYIQLLITFTLFVRSRFMSTSVGPTIIRPPSSPFSD